MSILPISKQLKQRSEWEEEGDGGENERCRNGFMVQDTVLECYSGFNYRQRNSLFKYLEHRWSLCVHQALCVCVCVCTLTFENLFVHILCIRSPVNYVCARGVTCFEQEMNLRNSMWMHQLQWHFTRSSILFILQLLSFQKHFENYTNIYIFLRYIIIRV